MAAPTGTSPFVPASRAAAKARDMGSPGSLPSETSPDARFALWGAMPFDKERGRKPVKPARPTRPRPRTSRESAFEGDRIAKVMARVGLCSRRDAEEWVRAGRVAVNGMILTDPARNITDDDEVTVDGQPLLAPEKTRLFLFNKPRGLVTTDHDPEGRPTVFAWLAHHHPDLPRVISIGRLDINTEGLLLLTNDGGLARVLELPATGWLRRYRVRAHGTTTPDAVAALKNGVTIDGVDYQPVDASLDRVQGANTWLTVALREGKNREVRRVLEHLGLEVNRLIRLSYGPFQLGEAPDGAVEEVKTRVLMDQLGPHLIAQAGADFSSLRRDEEAAHQASQDEAERPPPKRNKPVAGARKHVSVVRAKRGAQDTGERVRTERGATTDRRGRTVQVERVAAAVAPREPVDTRNGRRFRAERSGGPDAGKRGRPDGARSSRDERPKTRHRDERAPARDRDARPPRRDRDERAPTRFSRDERPGRSGSSTDRPAPRAGRDERPARSRTPDDRAKPPRRDERPPARFGRDERPARFDAGRPPARSSVGKPGGRPPPGKSGGRPPSGKPGGRPFAGKPGGGRSGFRPDGGGGRSGGNRPR